MEISLRLRFPQCLPERKILSCLASDCAKYFAHVYEWTDGVLISNDEVRI